MSGTLNDLPEPVLANRAGADLGDRIALHRAEGGGMAGVSDRWLDGGSQVPGYVADVPAESQAPGDRRCPRYWSRGGTPDVAVRGTGVLAVNGGGSRWGWTARMW